METPHTFSPLASGSQGKSVVSRTRIGAQGATPPLPFQAPKTTSLQYQVPPNHPKTSLGPVALTQADPYVVYQGSTRVNNGTACKQVAPGKANGTYARPLYA